MRDENDQTSVLLQKSAAALKQMQARLDAVESSKSEPIAVVGMACRLPGGCDSPEQFWELLESGRDGIRDVPPERWDIDKYYDAEQGAEGKMYVRGGGFVDGLDQFDPGIFGITPREAMSMDPQQRMLLETSWEALERAGIAPDSLVGSDTGVFVGISSQDYFQHTMVNRTDVDPYSGTGAGLNVASGRISYVLGLQGPNCAVDTACSSSLVALHTAIRSLRAGECSLALAGGVNAILNPMLSVYFCQLGALSPDSRCKTFDASANGYARGEGCGMVVLKRLSDAQAAGDRILAVLRGSAVNHDGRSGGLTVPNGPAQKAVLRRALEDARLAPADVAYIEAHGTGTPLGDPIEMHALVDVFARDRAATDPLTVGSVKTNIGHLEAAAGVAGVIKVILSMQHEKIPRHLHLNTMNPHISLDGAPVRIPVTPLSWPAGGDRKRIAGVSSFGISGTNAHVVIEEAPRPAASGDTVDEAVTPSGIRHVLPLSARSGQGLAAMAARLHDALSSGASPDLARICRTVAIGRTKLPVRAALKAETSAQMAERLKALSIGQETEGVVHRRESISGRPRVAFLFSGQGAQYNGMGRKLYRSEPAFRAALDRADACLAPHLGCSIIEVMHAGADDTRVHQTRFTQPALFALEYALAELWRSWGVEPDLVLGHSVGEFAAACVAGVLTLESAAELIAERGRLMQALPEGGAMAAIFAGPQAIQAHLAAFAGKVGIAAANGPRNIVVSGEQASVDALLDRLSDEGIQSAPLNVSHAFHSHLMDPMLDELRQVAAKIAYKKPGLRYISNLTGEVADQALLGPKYWADHARQAVLFEKGMRTAAEIGCTVFLEIGPHATLATMGQQVISDATYVWLTSLRRGADDGDVLGDALAALHVQGVTIDWRKVFGDIQGPPLILPTYPFEREKYWIERRDVMPGDAVPAAGRVLHPLLGCRMVSAGSEMLFQSSFSATKPTWLVDHAVDGRPIFPAAGYLEVALAAAREAARGKPFVLEDIAFEAPLVLSPDTPATVQTVLRTEKGGVDFEIHSLNEEGNGWHRHAAGHIAFRRPGAAGKVDMSALRATCPEQRNAADNYAAMRAHGMEYGPAFQGIAMLHAGDRTSMARIVRPATLPKDATHLPPALSDACLQALGATFTVEGSGTLYLPIALERLEVLADTLPDSFVCHTVLREGDSDMRIGDIELLDDDGTPLARIVGIRLRKTSVSAIKRAMGGQAKSIYHDAGWAEHPLDLDGAAADGAILILGDEHGIGERLASNLGALGTSVHRAAGTGSREQLLELVSRPVNGKKVTRVVVLQGTDLRADAHAIDKGTQLVGGAMLELVQGLATMGAGAPALTLVTCGAQAVGSGPCPITPEAAPIWGFGRVVQSELSDLQLQLCDLDPADIPGSTQGLANQLLHPDGENQLAWRHGVRHVARLGAVADFSRPERLLQQLQIPTRGELDGLTMATVAEQIPGPGQVKIAVHATGLNFRDVLNALGMYPGDPGPLGGECAGVVVALGEGVDGFAVGDKVTGIAAGSFRTEVLADARQVARIPTDMDFAGAATLPIAFLTAHYALNRLGKMKPGDRVLIHAAAGGVGQAAVQLARAAGARIFATAGSPEKRQLLKRQGVDVVMDSRSVAFAEQVMEATDGEGIDLVLNSLVGEALTKSLGLLREGGRFLEIGKMELLDEGALKAYPDIAYHTIALDSLSASDPDLVGGMLGELMVEFAAGRLKPLSWHGFTLDRAQDAFRFMQHARHIGKIVLTQPSAASRSMPLRADGTYLVTGGTGGLGLYVAEHLAERGAGMLALMSRRPPTAEVQRRIEAIEAKGCRVTCLQADVADRQSLASALDQLDAVSAPPIRGVIHAAGVLDDGAIAQQSASRFLKVMAPKVQGAWNLHELTLGKPLELFVMFSSASAVMGAAGQSNYAAANAFLDTLAHYRAARGLAGTSINWGPWSGAGMAASLDDEGAWEERGMTPISPQDGMVMLDRILDVAPAQVMVMPINWSQFLSQMPPGMDIPLLRDVAARNDGTAGAAIDANAGNDFLAELEQLPEGARRSHLQEVVEVQLLKVLGMKAGSRVDARQPLNDLGMDSLMAVELRNALSRTVGRPLSATLLFDYPSVEALTGYLADDVLELSAIGADCAAGQAAAQAEVEALVAHLSETDLEASLDEELRRAGF